MRPLDCAAAGRLLQAFHDHELPVADEIAVSDVVHGRVVKNIEALANPEALKLFENRVELKS